MNTASHVICTKLSVYYLNPVFASMHVSTTMVLIISFACISMSSSSVPTVLLYIINSASMYYSKYGLQHYACTISLCMFCSLYTPSYPLLVIKQNHLPVLTNMKICCSQLQFNHTVIPVVPVRSPMRKYRISPIQRKYCRILIVVQYSYMQGK